MRDNKFITTYIQKAYTMKQINYFFALGLIFMASCKNKSAENSTSTDNATIKHIDKASNGQNSLDWVGIYEGTFNCEECDNSKVSITLRPDNYYHYKNEIAQEKAYILWSNDGSTIMLSSNRKKFKVLENKLIALNNEGQPLKDKSNHEIGFIKKETAEAFEFDEETTNEETANKIKEFLRGKFKDELAKNALKENDKQFTFYELDLNSDRKNEYLVSLSGTYNCGVGGCCYYLLNNDFTVNTYFTVMISPIFRSFAKTNGWNDLIMIGEKDAKGNSLKFIHLKYNAKTKSYPSNPSLVPQTETAPSGHDMTMWHDSYGFAKPFSF
jgi:NlpE N-terminal domain